MNDAQAQSKGLTFFHGVERLCSEPGGAYAQFEMFDLTQSEYTTIYTASGNTYVGGAEAEWIMERPTRDHPPPRQVALSSGRRGDSSAVLRANPIPRSWSLETDGERLKAES